MGDLTGIGTAVAGLFSGIGSYASSKYAAKAAREAQEDEQAFNAEQAKMNRDWQTAEREAQNAWELEQWHRNNEYNSLDAQIQRALKAGVNPNSIFGNGSGNIASTAPDGANIGSGSQASTPSIANGLMELFGQQHQRAITAMGDMAGALGSIVENGYKPTEIKQRIELMKHNINIASHNGTLTETNAKIAKENLKWIAPLNGQQLKQMQELTNKYREEMTLIKQQTETEEAVTKLTELKQLTEVATADNILVDSEKKIAETDVLKKQEKKIESEIKNIDEQTAKEKFLNDFRRVTGLDPQTTLIPAAIQLRNGQKNQFHDDDGDYVGEDYDLYDLIYSAGVLFGGEVVSGAVDLTEGTIRAIGDIITGLASRGMHQAAKALEEWYIKFLQRPHVEGNTITWRNLDR